ncbi:hypothetical protein GDO81_020391 [Engystomops pustulosus]|uniref:G-protein coupled receptors family 1 profile domain-containing protein n=1 Tax=Engystomops pustulosus TaxID=76066 RepID=A0AAV6ZEN4_ENGPU|nr:hypothetical protein GDO81_020391 [Engystomops pustulosus]
MDQFNQTSLGGFILFSLSNFPFHLKVFGFLAFLMMYLITLFTNFLLIIAVKINPKLKTPLYFFLTNLAFIDICFTTTVVPKILVNTLTEDNSISLLECGVQMHFHLTLGCTECFLLAVMAYDRFAAICRPLHYNTIMSRRTCICLVAVSWTSSFINSIIHVIYTFQMSFCRSHFVPAAAAAASACRPL